MKEHSHQTEEARLTEAIEHLDHDIEELDTKLERHIKVYGWLPTFLRGIVGALGAAVGATIVLGFIVYALQRLVGVPYVGDIIDLILSQVQQNK